MLFRLKKQKDFVELFLIFKTGQVHRKNQNLKIWLQIIQIGNLAV